MVIHEIDLNTDTGEFDPQHLEDQIALLDFVSSCNIATGFHAGDPYTMSVLIREADRRNIAIGAHPSYPDRSGFGRKSIALSAEELFASLTYQIGAISGLCKIQNTRLHHLKLHGALYHDAHSQPEIAHTVIRFLKAWNHPLRIYGQSGSILEELVLRNGIPWVSEGFVDRRYAASGHLVPRSDDRGLISDPSIAISQAISIIRHQKVTTVDGPEIPVNVETLCIHGDHPNALSLARSLRQALVDASIVIKSPEV